MFQLMSFAPVRDREMCKTHISGLLEQAHENNSCWRWPWQQCIHWDK